MTIHIVGSSCCMEQGSTLAVEAGCVGSHRNALFDPQTGDPGEGLKSMNPKREKHVDF